MDAANNASQTDQPQSVTRESSPVDIPRDSMALQLIGRPRAGGFVMVESLDGSTAKEYFVEYSSRKGKEQSIQHLRSPVKGDEIDAADEPDYYEVLQINRQAETEAIHRIYRIMAARFHPDNPETGDVEKFLLLKKAYEVLSDPALRAEYEARHRKREAQPLPIFELKDFVNGVHAEANRRLGVLSLLYNQRRQDPERPVISLLELERLMAFPREYLGFSLWYLRSKQYVTVADNSDFVLTALGVDYVEENIGKSKALGKMLFPNGEEGEEDKP
jgi:hypothetical protein